MESCHAVPPQLSIWLTVGRGERQRKRKKAKSDGLRSSASRCNGLQWALLTIMSGSDRVTTLSGEDDVLDSWKEIAAYLGRSVRAVQGWEKDEDLPVHRHLHERQGSVYAYRSELDAWRRRRSATPGSPAPVAASRRPANALLASVVGLVLIGAAAWWIARQSSSSDAVALSIRPQGAVIVAALENRTGESLFDGTIEYLLERELAELGVADMVSRERTADVLKLMKQPPDAALSPALAREVALRDGGVRAIVAPRIQQLGTRYIMGVDVLDPATGHRAARLTAEAAAHEDIAQATRTLAHQIGGTLGDQMPRNAASATLERVTSPSLRAVQLFTRADRMMVSQNRFAAERLLLQALDEDPAFASAHMHLAFVRRSLNKPQEQYLPHADRAAELAATASDRERYFILGSHASLHGRDQEAIGHYKTLLEIDPNHFLAASYIGDILKFRLGRPRDAVPYRLRVAELRPHEFVSNFMAGESLANWTDRPAEARAYFDRAESLITAEDEKVFPHQAVWTRLFTAQQAWVNRDFAAAESEIDRRSAGALVRRGPSTDLMLEAIGYFNLALRRHDRAEQVLSSIRSPMVRARYQAHLLYALGRRTEARAAFDTLLTSADEISPLDRFRAAQVGVDAALLHPESGMAHRARLMIDAELALRRGDRKTAIASYRAALGSLPDLGSRDLPLQLAGLESLVVLLEAEGTTDEALSLIEQARLSTRRVQPDAMLQWHALERHFLRLTEAVGQADTRQR
jgi:tetratricopeptide (TPR) repeat protein